MSINTIGVLTSGGDAPGMNACIRAVVRGAINKGFNVKGVIRGFQGLITRDIIDIQSRNYVSEIINRGGTILRSARCKEMYDMEGKMRAAETCKELGIDCLIAIGGDGTYRGALALSELGINTIVIPGSIDLDIASTEYTIGFDTAVNTALESIIKLRDTSSSHDRCSVVEVMGRDAGHIALWCGLAGGADVILVPEKKDEYNSEYVIDEVTKNRNMGKIHNIVVVAEGVGNSAQLAKEIQEKTGIEARATILGHLQRGGSPTALDRVHASMMGEIAVEVAADGRSSRAICLRDGRYIDIDLREAIGMTKTINKTMYDISRILT